MKRKLRASLRQFISGGTAESGGGAHLAELKKLNDSVYEFYSPPHGTSSNVEIVFFHGLEPGDYSNAYAETWTSGGDSTPCYWPQTWLSEIFPRARILSVSYDSSIRKGKEQGRLDLHCTAENLLQDLMDDYGRVATKDGCPLILVGKDLGGQVIKAVCCRAHKYWKATFLSNLKGIFFYGTPHLGVPNLPTEYNGALAKGLRCGDEEIARLNNDFRLLRSVYKWAAKAILPPPGAKKFRLEIPEASVRTDVDDCYTSKNDIDTICKPRDKTSSNFRRLVELVSLSLQSNPNQWETSEGIGFKPSLDFRDDENYVPMQTTVAQVRRALKVARIVMLHGGPGSGKSSLARYLALRFQDQSRKPCQGAESSSNQTSTVCFPDGVVLLNCGHEASITTKQQELLRKFHIEIPLEEEILLKDDKGAVQLLREKLVEISKGNRRALVVLDDVWDSDLVRNLLVGVGQVKYLLTTQNSMIWSGSGVEKVKIEDVTLDEARQILGNYANFAGGVMPDNLELKNLADDIIKAAEHHPLALATLAIIVDTGDRNSVRDWQLVKNNYVEYLSTEGYPAVIFDEQYPRSTHASMMLMVDKLDNEAKNLLYRITLFAGPYIPETVVQIFLKYTLPQGTMKKMNPSIKRLQVLGVVNLEQGPISWSRLRWNRTTGFQDWRSLCIHGLRQHFILTTREEDILRITNFLHDNNEFLHLGERSDFDMATVLCALYGAPSIKQRALKKMGSFRHWEDYSSMADELRGMVSLMSSGGERTTSNSQVAIAATEVLWKLFVNGEFDDLNIARLLQVPECITLTCEFLFKMVLMLHDSSKKPLVEALPSSVERLFMLLSNDGVNALNAILVFGFLSLIPENSMALFTQFPSYLQKLVELLAQNGRKHSEVMPDKEKLAESAVLLDENMEQYMQQMVVMTIAVVAMHKENWVHFLATPGLVETLVMLLSGDLEGTCYHATTAIGFLALSAELAMAFAKLPSCLERLLGLLVNVKKDIQQVAVWAVANVAVHDVHMDMLATPDLVERLVTLLSADLQDTCYHAARAIAHLTQSAKLAMAFAQFPSCLERLDGLLAENVKKNIQQVAVNAIANVARHDKNCVHMNMAASPCLVERLVMLLSEEFQGTRYHAARAIAYLLHSHELVVAFAQFPSCFEKVHRLLGEYAVDNIQQLATYAVEDLSLTFSKVDSIIRQPTLVKGLARPLSKEVEDETKMNVARAIFSINKAAQNRPGKASFQCTTEEIVAGDRVTKNQVTGDHVMGDHHRGFSPKIVPGKTVTDHHRGLSPKVVPGKIVTDHHRRSSPKRSSQIITEDSHRRIGLRDSSYAKVQLEDYEGALIDSTKALKLDGDNLSGAPFF